ncbi:MAG: acyltransferase family protein [Rhizobiaceae bacterium]
MQDSGRLHYVDHLRVAAFAILIVYHASVAFFPDMAWLIESVDKSALLSTVMKFPRAWRLALLFFIAGMGTWFAFRSVSGPAFLRERIVRLLVPLIFAMCVVVAPQVWLERVREDGYGGSFLTFWMQRYFAEGKYPDGQFTWAHMWFVAYLLTMTVACYPVFRLLADPRLRRVGVWFERLAASNWIYLLFLLPLSLNLALTPWFPRQTNALYNDGAWFAVWASWFGLGFLFARHHKAIVGFLVEQRWTSLALAGGLTAFLYRYSWAGTGAMGTYETMTPFYKGMVFALAWTMILTLVGFARRHLDRPVAAMAWLNRMVFPLYLVHQTIVVAALYLLLPHDLGVGLTYALVLVATVGLSLAFAMLADRLPWPARALVGLGEPPSSREPQVGGGVPALGKVGTLPGAR